MKKLRIGIVGCGAIGSSLAATIKSKFSLDTKLVGLYDIDRSKALLLSTKITGNKRLVVGDLNELARKCDLVIESASAKFSWQIAKVVLNYGCSCMIMSVGGVIDKYDRLVSLAKKNQAKVYIPSGAISGIDALKAAKMSKIKKVILTTKKNPQSFKSVRYIQDKKINLQAIKSDRTLFYDTADKAVKYFPQNINVAAVLSLAGIGAAKTFVKIIASPSARRNIHEISIESDAGVILSRTENVLHPDNPKTSYLAVLSALATLKQILLPVRVGT